MNKLTFAYWVLDEAPYFAEYIEFHTLQGVDHFIFYVNHTNSDNTYDVLKPYTDIGLVELRRYPTHIIQRNNFYMMEHMVKEQVGKTRWLHFGALDERVFCPNGQQLPDLLKDYEPFGGLCVAWEEFNSNGHVNKIPGLITDRFITTCYDSAKHIKTIIKPECAITHEGDPHNFKFKPGYRSVDENFNQVNGPWNTANPYTYVKIKNHHYRTLSLDEFNKKMNAGLLDHAGQENRRRPDADKQWQWCHHDAKLGTNTELTKYSKAVKDAIRNTYKDYPELLKLMTEWYAL